MIYNDLVNFKHTSGRTSVLQSIFYENIDNHVTCHNHAHANNQSKDYQVLKLKIYPIYRVIKRNMINYTECFLQDDHQHTSFRSKLVIKSKR